MTWCASGKRGFSSKAMAKAQAKNGHRHGGPRLRPYECPDCGWWHLTHGGLGVAKCKWCGVTMRWARMPSGKMNPLDLAEVPVETRGCVAFHRDTESAVVVHEVDRSDPGQLQRWAAEGRSFHLSHFATCAERPESLKRGRRPRAVSADGPDD